MTQHRVGLGIITYFAGFQVNDAPLRCDNDVIIMQAHAPQAKAEANGLKWAGFRGQVKELRVVFMLLRRNATNASGLGIRCRAMTQALLG